jgi:hypothetical protein
LGTETNKTVKILLLMLGGAWLAVSLLQNLCVLPVLLDDVPAAQKAAMRREWIVEQKEHEVLQQRWAHERALYEADANHWAEERLRWQSEERQEELSRHEERKRWEEEKKREGLVREEVERWAQGYYWTEPFADRHCYAYGTRAYRSMMKEADVCRNMPMLIHGHTIERPETCERDVSAWNRAFPLESLTLDWNLYCRQTAIFGQPGLCGLMNHRALLTGARSTRRSVMFTVSSALSYILHRAALLGKEGKL